MMGSVRADCLGLFPSYLHRIIDIRSTLKHGRTGRDQSYLGKRLLAPPVSRDRRDPPGSRH